MTDPKERPEEPLKPAAKRGPGKPRKTLTEAQIAEVETLAALLSQEQMADYFGIARNTLKAIMDRDPDISERYKRGKARVIGTVARSLIQAARDGDRAAQIFFLKTQAGWRETQNIDHTSSDGSMTPKGRTLLDFYNDHGSK